MPDMVAWSAQVISYVSVQTRGIYSINKKTGKKIKLTKKKLLDYLIRKGYNIEDCLF